MRYGLLVLVLWVLFLVGTVLGLGGREMLVLGGIFGAMGVTVATVCWLDAREQRGLR